MFVWIENFFGGFHFRRKIMLSVKQGTKITPKDKCNPETMPQSLLFLTIKEFYRISINFITCPALISSSACLCLFPGTGKGSSYDCL